ncbi:NADH-cytochrome b5 reductase [Coemansia biformis]|uniref:NADH-cytochrome b5 reductase n=1 Tax=Coemansia biformis TaxID=1286918 RepID=A0A9W7YBD8_9FUNG|nr:NADH-cytochrome b5 reductase [Coemansia biformis]
MVDTTTVTCVVAALAAVGIAYVLLNPCKSRCGCTAVASPVLVLHPSEYRKFKLVEKEQVSGNTARYRFALQSAEAVLGLPIGRHIQLMVEVGGKEVARSYTPTSTDSDRGFFELVVKTYESGIVSAHLGRMDIGDSVNVRGPRGAFQYQPNMVRALGMIAGGTGITPMYQIIQHILANPEDKTHVSVIFANVNEDDILLREQLEQWAAEHDNLDIHYVLNNPPDGWQGGVGFVTKDMIQEWLPAPATDIKVLLCGPPPMVKAMGTHLADLGYDQPRVISKPEDQIFKF